jgi:hypothetical protein
MEIKFKKKTCKRNGLKHKNKMTKSVNLGDNPYASNTSFGLVEYQYSFTEFFEVTCLNLTLSLSE